MEWFYNIWMWVVSHKDEIVTFVTSSNTIGFVAAITMLIKQRRSIVSNTSTSKELNSSLAENKGIKSELEALKEANAALKTSATDSTDALDNVLLKINAMLDVQSLVYGSLRDENTRTAVANVLTNAKYAESATRAAIYKELESLRKNSAEAQAQVEESVSKAQKRLTVENISDVTMRG